MHPDSISSPFHRERESKILPHGCILDSVASATMLQSESLLRRRVTMKIWSRTKSSTSVPQDHLDSFIFTFRFRSTTTYTLTFHSRSILIVALSYNLHSSSHSGHGVVPIWSTYLCLTQIILLPPTYVVE